MNECNFCKARHANAVKILQTLKCTHFFPASSPVMLGELGGDGSKSQGV